MTSEILNQIERLLEIVPDIKPEELAYIFDISLEEATRFLS